jgi:hypothetical protein
MLGRLTSAAVTAAATGLAIGACGTGDRGRVIVRVAGSAITSTELSRSMSALAADHAVPDPPRYAACIARREGIVGHTPRGVLEQECREEYHELRHRALDQLIVERWLLGEAAARGLKAATAARAASAIQRMLIERAVGIAGAQVAAYYRTHRRDFLLPEHRYFDIHHFPTLAAARAAKRVIEAGGKWAHKALPEEIERPSRVEYAPERILTRKAIFAAKLHVLTGPIPVYPYHSMFEVTRIVPIRYKPLAQVRGAIAQELSANQRRGALAQFIAAWRSRWIARTDCTPGYIVQKCRQYAGPRVHEDPVSLS